MSGMFETQLLIACGRQNELGQVKSQDTFGGEAIKGLAPLLGTDVLVNNPACDAGGSSHTQSETSIVRNETTGTLCSAYNDSYHGVVRVRAFQALAARPTAARPGSTRAPSPAAPAASTPAIPA